jgi:Dynein heavy chain AAA lid domain
MMTAATSNAVATAAAATAATTTATATTETQVYDFNDSDLDAAIKLLGRFMDGLALSPLQPAAAVLPVDSLVFITGSIVYGGRVTDDWDRYELQMLHVQLAELVAKERTPPA